MLNAPNAYGNTPNAQSIDIKAHGNSPNVYGNAKIAHGNASNTYGNDWITHVDVTADQHNKVATFRSLLIKFNSFTK